MPPDRTVDEVLQSTSDSLFPADLGDAPVRIDSTGSGGDTPLHVLIWRGDTEGAIVLIRNGADVNAVGEMGETPLHVAISTGNREVITALLEAGAMTEIVSGFGRTAREKAAREGMQLPEQP